MTCHNGFVRKKSQTQRHHKPRKRGVQTSSKEISVMDNDARQGHDPMTAFPEFATPADIASQCLSAMGDDPCERCVLVTFSGAVFFYPSASFP